MPKILFIILAVFMMSLVNAKAQASPERGLFVWSLEAKPVLSSPLQMDRVVDYAKKAGIKTIYVQVYRANQSSFPSKIADASPYRQNFKAVSQDSFALFIRKAHAHGIEVHAWLNMLSLGANEKAPILKKFGPSILTSNIQPKKKLEDYKIDKQFFLEPSDSRVHLYLLTLIKELLLVYPDLDGIQFDYIRYPDVHPFYGYSKKNVDRFKKAKRIKKFTEEDPRWKQWKRDQVTELLVQLAQQARSIRPTIQISTTGSLGFARAYHEALQDWPEWVNKGIIEFVTIMDYPADAETFKTNITEIKPKVEDFSKVIIAVGAYKAEQSADSFKNQWEYCLSSGARGCTLFHYDSLIKKPEFRKIVEQ